MKKIIFMALFLTSCATKNTTCTNICNNKFTSKLDDCSNEYDNCCYKRGINCVTNYTSCLERVHINGFICKNKCLEDGVCAYRCQEEHINDVNNCSDKKRQYGTCRVKANRNKYKCLGSCSR